MNKRVSLADQIVLAGATAIENIAKQAGNKVNISFIAGRAYATQAQTNVKSFNYLKPSADGFGNDYSQGSYMTPTKMLVDKTNALGIKREWIMSPVRFAVTANKLRHIL